MNELAWAAPAGVVIAFGLLKISRQAGRIEEGVRGLYDRVKRLEDQHDDMRSNRR
jgi:hypothetical protein